MSLYFREYIYDEYIGILLLWNILLSMVYSHLGESKKRARTMTDQLLRGIGYDGSNEAEHDPRLISTTITPTILYKPLGTEEPDVEQFNKHE
jgi:hypothetical protein